MRLALLSALVVLAAATAAQPVAIRVRVNPASQPGPAGPMVDLPNGIAWSFVTTVSNQTFAFTNIVNAKPIKFNNKTGPPFR